MGELISSRDRVNISHYLTDDVKGTAADSRLVVTFTFTQAVEFGAAEIVGLSDREIIERARGLVASIYDLGDAVGGAYLLLDDADADLENMRGV